MTIDHGSVHCRMILDWMVILFGIADGDVLIHKHHSTCHLTDDQPDLVKLVKDVNAVM